jgi:hypothetical protein
MLVGEMFQIRGIADLLRSLCAITASDAAIPLGSHHKCGRHHGPAANSPVRCRSKTINWKL